MAIREEEQPLGPDHRALIQNEPRIKTSCFSCCTREPQGDMEDSWTSGGRAPPQTQEELEGYMRCESVCCSTRIGNWFYGKGITRCFCCFDCCFNCVQNTLISDGEYDSELYDRIVKKSESAYTREHTNKMIETEEWFRGFNCWPLPLLTLTMCAIETYYFVMLSNADNYRNALLDTDLAWKLNSKNEIHRLV